ncbi:flavin-containing monooxygenase [Ruania halotolerans]|uniref:flavin-containing monooxygenase n=1 Tax=Ruania halotolerans TaxID=2897773 RepID=UPI001E28EC9B|nr:NAD(P)/FAD-dependent oxidoreductase [Ruania halotolerans]UFU08153.1 NAD(P)/FAD-dependent oxidoreductase [Ruania halotolerans]
MDKTVNSVVIIGAGQSGLAAARAALDAELRPVVLEAGDRPQGSWPRYYDSLRTFSPRRFNSFPGAVFPGDPDGYPSRDEVAAHLERYASSLDIEIRTHTRAETVDRVGEGFVVRTAGGETIPAAGVVAASGSFGHPFTPDLPGRETFVGDVLHVADYRNPTSFAGRRVVVVGGGNSAVQVGFELGQVARTTLATRDPLLFVDQRPDGRDLHHVLRESGFDDLPPAWLAHVISGVPVLDTGIYREGLAAGVFDRRPMFTEIDGDAIVWADGRREQVDVIVFATGYRPNLGYLQASGALDSTGAPIHSGGVSATHPGLVYLGLEFQRSFSSNTLRGVHRDARYVMSVLAAHVRGAASALVGAGTGTGERPVS